MKRVFTGQCNDHLFVGVFRPQGAVREESGMVYPVTAGYFRTMGAMMLQGRDFTTAGPNSSPDAGYCR